MVVLFLKKTVVGTQWPAMTQVEEKLKEDRQMKLSKNRDNDDPTAGLMSMMKEMYQQGESRFLSYFAFRKLFVRFARF